MAVIRLGDDFCNIKRREVAFTLTRLYGRLRPLNFDVLDDWIE